ncbi:MAG: prolyl aminopeptidase [Burkholderiaceae bacterium]|nr:prolyl aminopeptidase [Burkholderiaceae bacterium]
MSENIVMFPPIEPTRHGMLAVDDLHTLYWEESGNPDGLPVLFLHGGPGGGTTPNHRRFFDPSFYRIILFDQRGAGKSTPLGEYRQNTTALLIEDIEKIRAMLGIAQWLVFGGSWGSTLALAYGEAHPVRCLGFVLRGIFLGTRYEVNWFMNGVKNFFPEVYEEFAHAMPVAERGNLMEAYAKRLFNDDPNVYLPAAKSWSRYEGACLFLEPQAEAIANFESDAVSIGLGRLEAHYMRNAVFLEEDQLVRNVGKIQHLPSVIVQGRYDVICPPISAYRLHQAWQGSKLAMVATAGHSAMEPGIANELVRATEQFKVSQKFT